MIVQKKHLRACIALSSMAASSLLFGNKYAFADEVNTNTVEPQSTATGAAAAAVATDTPSAADEPVVSAEMPVAGAVTATEKDGVKQTVLDPLLPEATEISGSTLPNGYLVFYKEDTILAETAVDETGLFKLPVTGIVAGMKIKAVVYGNQDKTTVLEETEWTVPATDKPAADVAMPDPITDPTLAAPEASGAAETVILDPLADETLNASTELPAGNIATETPSMSVSAAAVSVETAAVQEAKGSWYYYVQSGDSLQSIATHYATDVASLVRWNSLVDANKIVVGQLLSVNGTNAYAEIDKETRTFADNAAFVNYLGQYATDIGVDYNLYASVMVAQASLESAYGTSKLGTVGNNLFGIKGSYEGNSIVMRTWEEQSDGSIIWIDAFFRLYPSYQESMVDYAEKLRTGVSWDPNYYKGTWIENTTSYKDATLYLTGRYATDSSYYLKLNSIISAYSLTKFDGPKTVAADYSAIVAGNGYSIDSLPWGTTGYEYVASSSAYYGMEVHVSRQTADSQYSYISIDGKDLGWIDSAALKRFATVSTNYSLPIMNGGYSIDSLPWGEPGCVKLGDSATYYGKVATVVRETANGAYAEIAIDGVLKGWIDKKAFNAAFESYTATIQKGNYSIDSLPWGTSGYRTLDWSSAYVGKTVSVIGKSADEAYLCIAYNGAALGWVDYKAFESFGSVNAYYYAIVSGTNYSIDSQPWGEVGYAYLDTSANYYGKEVLVTRKTANGQYAYISINGKGLGWIDNRGLQTFTTKAVSYSLPIMAGNYSVDSLPWGEPGFVKVADASVYFGKIATVLRETANGAYAEITIDGQRLGWVDKRVFNNVKQADYYAGISRQSYSIDSLPWGTAGFQTVGSSNEQLGNCVKIIAETSDGLYKLVQKDGQTLGWIDNRALTAFGTVAANYAATIQSSGYSIDSLPWGTTGFTLVSLTSSYLNKPVQVIRETANGAYALIAVDGKTIGWVDKRSFNK
ncbi:lysin motif [Trichococcus palustris]|uniref:Peptidoglycan hydrolase n=1 Tax=Trichococcus palustris TaxID=140314 RepID=A0A143YUK5_9LACT|nr:GW dipeptide domain-containing protein [Trichococcus palustris]CZQ97146.1 lysin motif [Trichococcus palustris]SFK75579.1 Flagellum-specific peptidoglycan hydrolase FlgJ [Trichococcus palustris]